MCEGECQDACMVTRIGMQRQLLLRRPRAKPGHVRIFSDWLRGRPREKSANGVTDEVGE
jgi:hypothetical protein